MTAVFKSPYSVAGFLSPFNSLSSALNGSWGEGDLVEFAGSEERVIYGIIFGAYTFGGISLERLSMLEEMGVFAGDEIEVFLEGEAYPEMVLAVDKSMDERKHRRFRERFALLADRMPPRLKADLTSLGISGFVSPRPEDIDTILGLLEKAPTGYAYPSKLTSGSR
jgi:ABC-type phosphate/phosphonate transport system substrate-binding protein